MELAPAGDRSSIAAKRNMFEQQQVPPPRPPGPKKAPAVARPPVANGPGNGAAPPPTPIRPPAPAGLKATPSYPINGSAPPRPPLTATPKRSPSAPNMAASNPSFKKSSPTVPVPVPPAPYATSASYGVPAPPPQQVKPAPKKLQPNMIPPGLVVNKGPLPSNNNMSTTPTFGSTPPTSSPLSAPIPPPNPFASRQPGPITPPLSPNTSRTPAGSASPSTDNPEKKESFFNSLFGKKKAKERDITIGTPFNVNHRVHVNYNTTTGFEGLPIEWEAMLKSSGITKDEVSSNPDEVLSVLEFQAKRLLPTTAPPAANAPGICA